MKTFLRILIIAAILLILVFLSIGIVRVVPKALSSLASATVSIGSVFGGNNASSTNSTNNANGAGTSSVQMNGQNGNGGFVMTSTSTTSTQNGVSTTHSTSTSSSTSTSNSNGGLGSYQYNNYVPNPSGTSNTGVSNTSNTNSGTYSYTGSSASNQATCAANGSPNIAVSILSHGIITANGQYVETNTFSTGDTVSVKFKVENRGTCPTGAWSLHVVMPAQNSADQTRDLNGSGPLAAGAAITGQANFTSPRSGNSTVTITVTDASGKDSTTADNTASVSLAVTGSAVGTGTNYTYPVNTYQGIQGNFPVSGDGRPDLTVKIISVGTLDYNNNFTPVTNQNFPTGSRIAVRFQVVNQGLNATGPWTFRADVNDMYQPRSYQDPQTENSLPAGGSSTYTVSFDNLGAGQHTMTLYADSMNQVNEFNEGNNSLGVNFFVSGGNNVYPYNNNVYNPYGNYNGYNGYNSGFTNTGYNGYNYNGYPYQY
jgi:hypothetical protein